MSEGKIIIIGAILKIERPFRLRNMVEMTGMTPQACDHHLKRFNKLGILEKNDVWYSVADKNALLSEFVDAGLNKKESSKLYDTPILDSARVKTTNNDITAYLAFKALGMDGVDLIKKNVLQELDGGIESLNKGRRYINSAGMSAHSARKFLKQFSVLDLWEAFKGTIGAAMNREDFEYFMSNAMEEDE